MKVRLKRAQLGKAIGLDTTVKSASGWARSFCPTWNMVMQHKNGVMSDEVYIRLYRQTLDAVPRETWKALWAMGKEAGEVTLLCYCRDGKFCHTHLMIEYACEKYPKAFLDGRE
jgi:uncharacterized protein YeaO (DUF488 family)